MIIDPSTATLALLKGYAPLMVMATDGIVLADEWPTGISVPTGIVLQLAPSAESDVPIYEARFSGRWYGPSYADAWTLYQHTYALLYDASGFGRESHAVGRWFLRSADLTKPRQFTEPGEWYGYAASLRTRWNLMETL